MPRTKSHMCTCVALWTKYKQEKLKENTTGKLKEFD